MKLFAQTVCILSVRDCPFPQRINNQNIIITKSAIRYKGRYFFLSLHSEEKKQRTSDADARCVRERLLRKTNLFDGVHLSGF